MEEPKPENLLLKINGKLGGTNWILPELTHSHAGDRFMVFGADVTHPSPTQVQELRKSVAAVTGSVSLDLIRYAAVVRQQATTRSADRMIREIIDQMESMMEELLKVRMPAVFGLNSLSGTSSNT
ncbi:hypothetical protein AHF37_04938 [Paragonimus kellicotti]|nr:hypothetical protein AHF37_04938 [Paragonimus kellicotti]